MYYKVVSQDSRSVNGGNMQWTLPPQAEWHEIEAPLGMCRRGLHVTTTPWVWVTTMSDRVFEAEVGEIIATDADKVLTDRVRLVREIEYPQWWVDAQAFVATIPDTPFMRPDGDPLPEWRVFKTRDAARAAAWDAARDAAWSAARAAAWDAARDAAQSAAQHAAWNAAWNAAWSAARDAAQEAAWDVVWAAALMVGCLLVEDIIDPVFTAHARARWSVWQKGYGLYADVDGVLYVYEAVR